MFSDAGAFGRVDIEANGKCAPQIRIGVLDFFGRDCVCTAELIPGDAVHVATT